MKQNTHLFVQVAMASARGGSSSTPRSAPRRASTSVNADPSRSTRSSSASSPAWNWQSIAPQQPRQHGEDLEERRGLARPRRPRMDTRAEHVDEQGADDQDHVAAQHDGRDPEREHLEVGEGHERRREQELVGDRVEERAEAALAPLATGDPAVEQVGQGGDREDNQRRPWLPVDEERDEDWDQEDPQNREPVGEAHGRAAQSSSPREAAGASTTYGASRPRRRAANSTSSRTASGSSARASTRPCS